MSEHLRKVAAHTDYDVHGGCGASVGALRQTPIMHNTCLICTATMDLPMIGAHCALETCNVNDFLPIRCKCDRLFCKDHISPEMHACITLHTEDKPAASSTSVHKLQRCAADKCNKPSLEAFVADNFDTAGRIPAVCERCKQSYCATYVPPTYFTVNLTQESTGIGLQLHILVRLQIRTSHLLVMRRRRLY